MAQPEAADERERHRRHDQCGVREGAEQEVEENEDDGQRQAGQDRIEAIAGLCSAI